MEYFFGKFWMFKDSDNFSSHSWLHYTFVYWIFLDLFEYLEFLKIELCSTRLYYVNNIFIFYVFLIYVVLSLAGFRNPQFNCNGCPKSYKYKSNLLRHLRYECGKDPQFVCTICSRAYTQNSRLKLHMLNVHWDNKYVQSLSMKLSLYL